MNTKYEIYYYINMENILIQVQAAVTKFSHLIIQIESLLVVCSRHSKLN